MHQLDGKILSEKLFHMKTGAGCLVEKLPKDKKHIIVNETNPSNPFAPNLK